MADLLNLEDAPSDPIERLAYLSGVDEKVRAELELEYQRCYAKARLEGRFDSALALRLHSKKKALAFTRRANAARSIRWGDDLDPVNRK